MSNQILIEAKKRLFCAAFARHGSIVTAERETNIAKDNHYRWLRTDPQYRLDFARARKRAASAILNRIKELAPISASVVTAGPVDQVNV